MIRTTNRLIELVDVLNRNGISNEQWGVLLNADTNTKDYLGVNAKIPLKGNYIYVYTDSPDEEAVEWDNKIFKPDMIFIEDKCSILLYDLNNIISEK